MQVLRRKLRLSFPMRQTFLAQADFPMTDLLMSDIPKLGGDGPPPSRPSLIDSALPGTTPPPLAALSMAEFINDEKERRRTACGSHISLNVKMNLRAMVYVVLLEFEAKMGSIYPNMQVRDLFCVASLNIGPSPQIWSPGAKCKLRLKNQNFIYIILARHSFSQLYKFHLLSYFVQ